MSRSFMSNVMREIAYQLAMSNRAAGMLKGVVNVPERRARGGRGERRCTWGPNNWKRPAHIPA